MARRAGRAAAAEPRDLSKVLEQAIRFIAAKEHEQELQFAIVVGRFLFEELFRGDLELFRSNQPWKTESIAAIARDGRVRLPESVLYRSVHVHLMVEKLGKLHPGIEVPDIPPYVWSRMWRLHEQQDDSLFEVLSWVAREKIPRDLVAAVVQTVGPYVAAGGRLEDLLVGDPDRVLDTPYLRVRRMLSIVRAWLRAGAADRMSGEDRALAIEHALAIEAALAVTSRGADRPSRGSSGTAGGTRGSGPRASRRRPKRTSS